MSGHKMLRPKVLVAAQTRTIEAVADEKGEWLPGVPVTTRSHLKSMTFCHLPQSSTRRSPRSPPGTNGPVLGSHQPRCAFLPRRLSALAATSVQRRGRVTTCARRTTRIRHRNVCSVRVTGDEAEMITAWWRTAGQPRRKRASPIGKNPSSVD